MRAIDREKCEREMQESRERTMRNLQGKGKEIPKRDAGVGRGKRCNAVTRQVAFVNRKTMAPAGSESEGRKKRLAREGLRKCTSASE